MKTNDNRRLLDGRNVLLTGGSRGIGAAISKRLLDSGCNVFSTSSKNGDLADPATPEKIWQEALDYFDGHIDILINNAGIFEAISLDGDLDNWNQEWLRTLQINLVASATLCRQAVAHFKETGFEGRIINIASRAAHRGDSPEYCHYAASKAGLVALTKTLARGYGADRILSFAVCPGMTSTDMVSHQTDNEVADRLRAEIPIGRFAEPEEVAEITAFLALEAPPSMTGSVIDVNGASYVR